MPILCTGEILWDVFGRQELLGGAPLNFSAAVRRLGHPVALLTAVGDDAQGHRALEELHQRGLSTDFVEVVPGIPTGTAEVTTDAEGNAHYAIQRPTAFDRLTIDEDLFSHIEALRPDWIYFGTLAQTEPRVEQMVRTILGRLPSIRRFYDMNLREGHWNLALIERLSSLAHILKFNDTEAATLHRLLHPGEPFHLESFCREWAARHSLEALCVTLGGEGCAILTGGRFCTYPGFRVQVVDTVGAGDAFAAAYLHGVLQHWTTEAAAKFANATGALVASRAGATPQWSIEEVRQLMHAAD